MSNRLCVIFWLVNSAKNPYPQPVIVARGHFESIDLLWQVCAENLPDELMSPESFGHVFIGHEHDYWIKNLVHYSAHAEPWQGTVKSGFFKEFLKGHIERHCPEMAEEVVLA